MNCVVLYVLGLGLVDLGASRYICGGGAETGNAEHESHKARAATRDAS